MQWLAFYRSLRSFKWRPEAGRFLKPNRRLLWQTGVLLQWTMGDSVWRQLRFKWCKSGLSSTRVLNLLHSTIRNSWNARVSIIGSSFTLYWLTIRSSHDVLLLLVHAVCYTKLRLSYRFSQALSSTRTWLDELRCSGTESRLINCPANAIGVEDCSHSEDIALSCTESKSQ